MRKFIQILTDYPWQFDADQQDQPKSEGEMNQIADANILHLLFIGEILVLIFNSHILQHHTFQYLVEHPPICSIIQKTLKLPT